MANDTPPEPRFTRYECSAKCPYLVQAWGIVEWCKLFLAPLAPGNFKNPERCDECMRSQEGT